MGRKKGRYFKEVIILCSSITFFLKITEVCKLVYFFLPGRSAVSMRVSISTVRTHMKLGTNLDFKSHKRLQLIMCQLIFYLIFFCGARKIQHFVSHVFRMRKRYYSLDEILFTNRVFIPWIQQKSNNKAKYFCSVVFALRPFK